MNFKILKREIFTDFGKEIVIEKKYNHFIDQEKNRLWVFQPQEYARIADRIEALLCL